MNLDPFLHQGSLAFVEEQYERFLDDPSSVEPSWRRYFEQAVFPVEGRRTLRPTHQPASIFNPGGGAFGAPALPTVRGPAPLDPPARPGLETPSGQAAARPHQPGQEPLPVLPAEALTRALALHRWVDAWRARGHFAATLDPLGLTPPPGHPELSAAAHGLEALSSDTPLPVPPETLGLPEDCLGSNPTLGALQRYLSHVYGSTIGLELSSLDGLEERRWLQARAEDLRTRRPLDPDAARRFFDGLARAEGLEQFLHTRFMGAKRFSLEGGESLIPLLEHLLEEASRLGVEDTILGMAHRGRLNVMTQILQQSPIKLFAKFDDHPPKDEADGARTGKDGHRTPPDCRPASGDVKYHLGASTDRVCRTGKKLHLSLCFNPSHLEIVNPVVEGRVRARQDRRPPEQARSVLPLIIHGDAAFIGQGVVAETLNLSGLEGYSTQGTVHLVINNQIGFTTAPGSSRSTPWCTDFARIIQAPVFHVNGEDPDALCWVASLAIAYRQHFGKDVVIDLVCYRKYGHNESDEPTFTQPRIYKTIASHKSLRERYGQTLDQAGVLSLTAQRELLARIREGYEHALQTSRLSPPDTRPSWLEGYWAGYRGGLDAGGSPPQTGLDKGLLQHLSKAITQVPRGFTPHRKLARLLSDRARMGREEERLDWGMGEHLAFASLVNEGHAVRLSGQDAGRGTFSHRHAVLTDPNTQARYLPLQHVREGQARFEVYDSSLSELAVLGFDYGYSLDAPAALVLWEAQFGDFSNGAQILIDQFLAAGEDKWRRLSGLTLLLPHGFEGQGPEHSSARLERYLQLCANENMQVCAPTTAAQIFHLLRRQVHSPLRKPLIVMSPKSLLRHRLASSPLSDLEYGSFQTVIGEHPGSHPEVSDQILICSGRFYTELLEGREHRAKAAAAHGRVLPHRPIVRLEQLYPFPEEALRRALEAYPQAKRLSWVQEEPENMGALSAVMRALSSAFGTHYQLDAFSRVASASPASGSTRVHHQETLWLLDQIFA